MEKLTLHKYMDYSSNLNFVAGQVANDGSLLLMETDEEELDFFQRPVPKLSWTIRVIKEQQMTTIEIPNISFIPSHVDLFSDGTLLLVQSRCYKDGNSIERNARRYNSNGQLVEAFILGDGIEQVQIDETDTIWVGYFDEGIFGNFGWEKPMGSDGLIAYSKNGQKLWGAIEYGIIDCYALNVASSKEVYFYYYDDFFLVQLDERREETRFRIESRDTIQNFVLWDSELIAQVDINKLKIYRKKKNTFAPKEKLQIVDEHNQRIHGTIFMRGKYLYVVSREAIYQRKLG